MGTRWVASTRMVRRGTNRPPAKKGAAAVGRALAAPAAANGVEGVEPRVASVFDAARVANENPALRRNDAFERPSGRLGIEPMQRAADRDRVERAEVRRQILEAALDQPHRDAGAQGRLPGGLAAAGAAISLSISDDKGLQDSRVDAPQPVEKSGFGEEKGPKKERKAPLVSRHGTFRARLGNPARRRLAALRIDAARVGSHVRAASKLQVLAPNALKTWGRHRNCGARFGAAVGGLRGRLLPSAPWRRPSRRGRT